MSLRDDLKARLNREMVAELVCFIGKDITRDFKFADNPSMSISRTGLIKDFGSTDFSGDIFDFIQQEKEVSFPEALEFVNKCLGGQYVA